MKKWIVPLMLGFGVALAIIVGQRMSTDAMAVVIGVAVGVAASVPTSVLLVALMRRDRRSFRPDQAMPAMPGMAPYPQLQQPPVIVINPNDYQRGNQQYMPMPPVQLAQDAGMRRLRVVGDDDEWSQGEW